MTKYLLAFTLFLSHYCFAQKDTAIINLEAQLSKEQNTALQLDIIQKLAGKTNFQNPEQFQAYLDKGIVLAEQSRQRDMMIKARIIAGRLYLGGGMKEGMDKARKYALEALEMCKTESDVSYNSKVSCNILMAVVERYSGKATSGLTYNQEAISIANESDDDSLKVTSLISYGNTLLRLDENLKAFKNYLTAQGIAEKSKHKNAEEIVNDVYGSFIRFYNSIENYEKAIDYQYKLLNYAKKNQGLSQQVDVLNSIGYSYIKAKKYDTAKSTFNDLQILTDSLNDKEYKLYPFAGMLETLLSGDEKYKGLQLLRSNPDLSDYFKIRGRMHILDQGYGNIYHELKMVDSANYYYERALPIYVKKESVFAKIDFFYKYGYHLYTAGNYSKAINLLKEGKTLCDTVKNLSMGVQIIGALDSCYQKMGDYKTAYFYSSLHKKTKDELNEKSKAKDVLALEIDSENRRKERLAKEEEENTQKRHNWQYMGIVMGIVALFTLLAAVGIFNVPIKWVRALGFIAFIFLFEFVILLADTWIHHATHGEPWKVLGIKVILIGVLLPLHHYLEHKAIELIAHRRNKQFVG